MCKAIFSERLSGDLSEARQAETSGTAYATQLVPTAGPAQNYVDVFSDAQSDSQPGAPAEDADLIMKMSVSDSASIQLQSSDSTIGRLSSGSKGTRIRVGLPADFVKRVGRYGRSVLLCDNVYRLPDLLEFIPQRPTGTLGARHVYALLTHEQYLDGRRSTVYVRADGRIFDYGFDHGDPTSEMFDTGYTIHDLERTGRYAPDSAAARDPGGYLIRKLTSGKYRLYSRKKDPKTGKRKNLGTFSTRKAAEKHERDVQYFKNR